MPRRRRPTLTFPALAFPALAALLAAALALVLALPLLVAAQPQPEIRGVWLTLNDMAVLRDRDRMRSAVADLARLHVNTLYPVVWNGGYAWYPSEVTQRRGLQHFTPRGLQGQDPLTELVAEAHGHARHGAGHAPSLRGAVEGWGSVSVRSRW